MRPVLAPESPGSSVGETVALVSFSMLFATLMMALVAYRFSSEAWPPMGLPRVSLALPLGNTLLILASSGALWWFCQRRKPLALVASMALGAAFLGGQVLLWNHFKAVGLWAEEGIFQSLLYGLTGIHGAHVAIGLGGLGLLWIPQYSGRFVVKFWHFLTILWPILFVGLFVL